MVFQRKYYEKVLNPPCKKGINGTATCIITVEMRSRSLSASRIAASPIKKRK